LIILALLAFILFVWLMRVVAGVYWASHNLLLVMVVLIVSSYQTATLTNSLIE
jgi:hypothetical protein